MHAAHAPREPLLIVGASARAAAQSAWTAGFQPYAADLFADADLTALCPATRVEHYPRGLAAAAAGFPPAAWMYTGGLENYPATIEAISRTRKLWGAPPEVVAAVRDPLSMAAALERVGLRAPRVALTSDGVPVDGSWLRKPLRSAGGFRITPWLGIAEPPPTPDHGWYYQERIAGEACSAVYVADGANAVLLGVTQQLIGSAWLHASGFAYAGSIGPLTLDLGEAHQWQMIGRVLTAAFGLRGLFGVDAMVNATGVWPVEVNPRYPASAEVLEAATSRSLVGLHAAACRDGVLPSPAMPPVAVCHGKAIYYAEHDLVFDKAAFNAAQAAGCHDLPHAGGAIAQGHPVFTLFSCVSASTFALDDLQRQAGAWDDRWR